MSQVPLLDARGYDIRRPPRNRGRRYEADPPTIDELVRLL